MRPQTKYQHSIGCNDGERSVMRTPHADRPTQYASGVTGYWVTSASVGLPWRLIRSFSRYPGRGLYVWCWVGNGVFGFTRAGEVLSAREKDA